MISRSHSRLRTILLRYQNQNTLLANIYLYTCYCGEHKDSNLSCPGQLNGLFVFNKACIFGGIFALRHGCTAFDLYRQLYGIMPSVLLICFCKPSYKRLRFILGYPLLPARPNLNVLERRRRLFFCVRHVRHANTLATTQPPAKARRSVNTDRPLRVQNKQSAGQSVPLIGPRHTIPFSLEQMGHIRQMEVARIDGAISQARL